jgi:glycosyltransferase involved in cell wall biosynthesis
MAEAALLLIEDDELAARIAEAAHIEVQQYSWANVRTALDAVYSDILAPKRVRRGAA